jgi:hypothetical protein
MDNTLFEQLIAPFVIKEEDVIPKYKMINHLYVRKFICIGTKEPEEVLPTTKFKCGKPKAADAEWRREERERQKEYKLAQKKYLKFEKDAQLTPKQLKDREKAAKAYIEKKAKKTNDKISR